MEFILDCKITPGMELFEQQYFTEQYIILTKTEERHEKDLWYSGTTERAINWYLKIYTQ